MNGFAPLVVGGDHSITFPILKAVAAHFGPINILHIDAHPDLYDELLGNRRSHASPFARIMEAGLCSRLVQVGIRTLNTHQANKRLDSESRSSRCVVSLHFRFPESKDTCTYQSILMDLIRHMRRACHITNRVASASANFLMSLAHLRVK